MVAYIFDTNTVLVEIMKQRKESEIIRVYTVLHTRLQIYRFKHKYQRLVNELSAACHSFISTKHIDFQLVPPHILLYNTVERAIITFTHHFLSQDYQVFIQIFPCILSLHLIYFINLVKNPKLSAYVQLEEAFDYNRRSLVQPSVKILVFEIPDQI